MRRVAVALVLVAALAAVPAAAARGSISTSTTSVASGDTLVVTVCVATAGDGGYLVVKGPNTFVQDVFFGPVTGCSDVSVTTAGWLAGKYRLSGYEFTTKGTSGLGSLTVTVT